MELFGLINWPPPMLTRFRSLRSLIMISLCQRENWVSDRSGHFILKRINLNFLAIPGPTLKVKRNVVNKMYEDVIDKFYV